MTCKCGYVGELAGHLCSRILFKPIRVERYWREDCDPPARAYPPPPRRPADARNCRTTDATIETVRRACGLWPLPTDCHSENPK